MANGFPESIGGVADHVHLLVGLRATHCLADVLRDLKAVSSGWIHNEIGAPRFGWQEGYGAFTVSSSQRERVRRYIEQQPSIIARVRFAKSIWNCFAVAAWNLTNVTFSPAPCRGRTTRFTAHRWFEPPANIRATLRVLALRFLLLALIATGRFERAAL